MPKFISSRKEQIEYLNNLSPEELLSWAGEVLARERSFPILLSGTEPDEFLLNFGKKSLLGIKIKNAISGLVSAWDISQGTAYLSELLYLVGMLDITDAHPRIIVWLERGNLKGLPGLAARSFFKEDAHMGCWLTIGYYHSQYPELRNLALRDIADDRYFLICYHILCEEDADYLFRFFPDFIRICMKSGETFTTFNNEFHRINENFGPEFFKKFSEEILPRLTKDEEKFFENAIGQVHYELKK